MKEFVDTQLVPLPTLPEGGLILEAARGEGGGADELSSLPFVDSTRRQLASSERQQQISGQDAVLSEVELGVLGGYVEDGNRTELAGATMEEGYIRLSQLSSLG